MSKEKSCITMRGTLPKQELKKFFEPFCSSPICSTIVFECVSVDTNMAQITLKSKGTMSFLLPYTLESGPLRKWGHHFKKETRVSN